jgi:hypothetical protein
MYRTVGTRAKTGIHTHRRDRRRPWGKVARMKGSERIPGSQRIVWSHAATCPKGRLPGSVTSVCCAHR